MTDPLPGFLLGDVDVAPGMDVVDLCCGDGWFTLPLGRIARSVVVIDIDATLLEAAQVRLAERCGAGNCTFVEAEAYDVDKVVRQPLDHVFLANAFHGVPDRPRLVRAIRGVLKSDGLFAVVNWHALPREQTPVLGEPRGPETGLRMTLEQTIVAVEAGGLKFHRRVEVSPYHYGAVFERRR